MTNPKLQPQAALVPPDAIHLEYSLTWVRRADHSVQRLSVADRPGGSQLILMTGGQTDWRNPRLLTQGATACLAEAIMAVHRHYVDPDPF